MLYKPHTKTHTNERTDKTVKLKTAQPNDHQMNSNQIAVKESVFIFLYDNVFCKRNRCIYMWRILKANYRPAAFDT